VIVLKKYFMALYIEIEKNLEKDDIGLSLCIYRTIWRNRFLLKKLKKGYVKN